LPVLILVFVLVLILASVLVRSFSPAIPSDDDGEWLEGNEMIFETAKIL